MEFALKLKQMPRYGVDEMFSSVSLFNMCTGIPVFYYFGLDTLKTEHFQGLKHINLPSPATQIGLCCCRYSRQSFAMRRTCDETVEGRTLI